MLAAQPGGVGGQLRNQLHGRDRPLGKGRPGPQTLDEYDKQDGMDDERRRDCEGKAPGADPPAFSHARSSLRLPQPIGE